MKQIEKKSLNPFILLKRKFVEFRSEMCFKLRNFLVSITKDMCFSKRELEEIKERVETTKSKEVKFNEFSEIAPEILNLIENLRGDVERLKLEKEFCMSGIQEIYLADVNGNEELKKMLFGKFGLPYILEN